MTYETPFQFDHIRAYHASQFHFSHVDLFDVQVREPYMQAELERLYWEEQDEMERQAMRDHYVFCNY
jgi:hypothetical protein